MKYIDAEKLKAEIERRIESWTTRGKHEPAGQGRDTCVSRVTELSDLLSFVTSLQQEQPDNEDIDKVAQELYEHLYELKRRNNVPTNLYDKQEIIDLWKAGIEYGRNHSKQEQPTKGYDEKYLNEKIAKAKKSWEGVDVDEYMDEIRGREPEMNLDEEIDEKWDEFVSSEGEREDFTRIVRHFYGLRNRALEKAARNVYESWMGGTMDDVRRDMAELDKVLNARKEE